MLSRHCKIFLYYNEPVCKFTDQLIISHHWGGGGADEPWALDHHAKRLPKQIWLPFMLITITPSLRFGILYNLYFNHIAKLTGKGVTDVLWALDHPVKR